MLNNLPAQLFLDPGCFTAQFTQVVQLGLSNVAATLDRYGFHQRAVGLKSTLNANAVGNFAHGKSR